MSRSLKLARYTQCWYAMQSLLCGAAHTTVTTHAPPTPLLYFHRPAAQPLLVPLVAAALSRPQQSPAMARARCVCVRAHTCMYVDVWVCGCVREIECAQMGVSCLCCAAPVCVFDVLHITMLCAA